MDDLLDRLVSAALPHVAFDGWSEATFRAAVADAGADPALARAIAPRGGLDLAVAYHRAGDRSMVERLAATDLSAMRFRDRIAAAVRFRLETADKEAVRRAVALFALPTHAAEGAGLVWQTASLIWEALGDSSQDLNWYSKRTILSAVYSGTVLFWLGDSSPGHEESWRFLDRRIENVMGFEKLKARVRDSALGRAFLDGPGRLLERIRKPESRTDLPGTSGRG